METFLKWNFFPYNNIPSISARILVTETAEVECNNVGEYMQSEQVVYLIVVLE